MNTTQIGRQAEDIVANKLISEGYVVIAQNWRNRFCEIDIVASKQKTVYFIEVKYRKSSAWGDGLDSITSKKLKQMNFAAEFWINQNYWQGNAELLVAAVSGAPPKIDEIIYL